MNIYVNRRARSTPMTATTIPMTGFSRGRAAWSAVAALGIAASLSSPTALADETRWTVPRTSDGQPDLQGYWTNNTVIPLERPAALGDKAFFTEEEVTLFMKERLVPEETRTRLGLLDRMPSVRPSVAHLCLYVGLKHSAKELGLPHQEWVDAATRAAAGDTARTGLLEIVAAMPLDPLSGGSGGLPTRGLARARIDTVGVNAWIEGLATAPGSPPFRHYLTLALRCSSAGPVTNPAATVPDGVRTVPLVRYRLGICGNAHGDELRAVRAADAEFVDADYVLGQYALQLRPYPDADEAARRFQSAAAAFPASPAIATSLGDVQQEIEDWNAALRAYDAALALVGDHPEALRGRTIVQATAGDYLGAIETATKLMARQVYLGEAFYWRAWSHFQLGHHEIARADADRMKTLRLNSRVFLLSGMIDWRLRRLESAEIEFEESITMDGGQCEAATFLGGVRNERGKSREALEAFKAAVRCWDLGIIVRREALRILEASAAPESYKTRGVARPMTSLAE